ncbi:MAG TPA: hypothetical protein VM597_20375 [Gemmataceae bacterium]|jgi:hypothetical protein|nr:hypothetical protein [Gemmataceae bacterium]
MFKWACLAVAAAFCSFLGWIAYDIRSQLTRSGNTVNEHLPAIVEKTHKTTETLAELSEDVRQLKELAGVTGTARDQNLVAYANSVIAQIEASGGVIGLKKTLGGKGLKDQVPAREWTVGARKEAVVLTALAKSKKELVTRLSKNKFGSDWMIQVGDQEPVALFDWLREHHPQSKEL